MATGSAALGVMREIWFITRAPRPTGSVCAKTARRPGSSCAIERRSAAATTAALVSWSGFPHQQRIATATSNLNARSGCPSSRIRSAVSAKEPSFASPDHRGSSDSSRSHDRRVRSLAGRSNASTARRSRRPRLGRPSSKAISAARRSRLPRRVASSLSSAALSWAAIATAIAPRRRARAAASSNSAATCSSDANLAAARCHTRRSG